MSVKLTDVVPKFGGKPDQDVIEWLKKVQLVARLQKVEKLSEFIPLFLVGAAFSVYDQLSEEKQGSDSDIKNALIRAFSLTPFQAYRAFVNRRLVTDETPDAYLADLRRLLSLMGNEEKGEVLACQFVEGLPESVGSQVKAQKGSSLNVEDLLECTKHILADKPRVPDPELAAAGGVQGQGLKRQGGTPWAGQARKPGGASSGAGGGRGPRCFGCNRIGHAQKDCTVECFNCKEKGHISRNCDKSGNGAGSPSDAPAGTPPKD